MPYYNSVGWQSETNDEGNAVIPDVKNNSRKSLVIFNLHEVHLIKIFHKLQASQIKPRIKQDFGNEKPVIASKDLYLRMSLTYCHIPIRRKIRITIPKAYMVVESLTKSVLQAITNMLKVLQEV